MIDDKMLKYEINDAFKILPDEIRNDIRINLYYKYQPSISSYIR